jgi:hypothetical protein
VAGARLLEAAANVAVLAACLWPIRKPVGSLLASIPRPHAVVTVASVAVLIGAQAYGEGEAVYPLTDFGMYTASLPAGQLRFVEYTARLSSGREEPLSIARLLPIGGSYLRRRVGKAVDEVEARRMTGADPKQAPDLDAMLAALARRYETLHPDDPVRAIRVRRASIPMSDDGSAGGISRSLVYEYRVR